GLYTVLVDGDDLEDPIADAVRSILDGHIVLSRALANKSHYPAIDILASISRCRTDIISPELKELSSILSRSLAVYRKNEDLINIGAYAKGSDPEIDTAIKRMPELEKFLVQGIGENSKYEEVEAAMKEIVA
ncbi:MAG: EscN/YscN/HrcN family type III secretion system ATPase, partial [Fibromonadales bacterium]|nr:EscN/YscN/HrcN family type III secretion system ATPase [Fibromonadales bacterium]